MTAAAANEKTKNAVGTLKTAARIGVRIAATIEPTET